MTSIGLLSASLASAQRTDEATRLLLQGKEAIERNEPDAAIDALGRLRYVAPLSFERLHLGHYALGMALAERERAEEAFHAWRAALETRERQAAVAGVGDDGDFRENVMGTVQHAAASFVQAARLRPSNVPLQSNAAVALAAIGETEPALEALEAARRLAPSSAGLPRQMGMTLASTRPAEAAALLREALRVEPQHTDACETLASLECASRGQDTDACTDAWIAAFGSAEAAAARGAPDLAALHKTAASAGKLLYKLRRVDEARAVGARAAALGGLMHPMQMPRELVRGVSATPWRDDAASWRAVRLLEAHADEIRDEVLGLHRRGGLLRAAESDSENLVDVGEWRELNFIFQGTWVPQALALLPRTFGLVTSLPEASSMVIGATKISVMQPGTHVHAHTGLTNARLRIHLGLAGLDGAYVRVGDEPWRTWRDGRCIVFDDSFVHEVWHNGTETRIVLIVDVWHVDMDEAQRREHLVSSSQRKLFVEAYKRNRAQFGASGLGKDKWF